MQVRREAQFVRRRRYVAAGAVLAITAGSLTACMALGGDDDPTAPSQEAGPGTPSADDAATSGSAQDGFNDAVTGTGDDAEATTGPAGSANGETPVAAPPAIPSAESFMERIDYITGTAESPITPKSVVASGAGLVIANNMMYSHTSTVYDAQTRELVATLSDEIVPADFGVEGHPGTAHGAPVEAAWTADGKFAYVSQYTMYGENFGREGFDDCSPESGVGPSFLYRFNAELMTWDQVIKVGAVPKYVDITPDQSKILVSNWCDSTLSVVDAATGLEEKTIPIAAAPRGIEGLPDNRTAYVAAMYADKLFKVDLETGESEVMMETGRKPRHLNLSDDGKYLFMAVSGSDTIYKIDTETEEIVDQVISGREPRSMILSSDGSALYVVNYYEPSVAKISTDDMEVLQKEPTDANPIGITYEPITHTVWVACYGGSIYVFDDTLATDPDV